LANEQYDLVVIGGGIYGACVARDAALRGLRVALVERGDFGGATSANSLKIIHGGLRYFQDGDLRLVRRMSQERQTWLRIAPHLVHPLPCLMPAYPSLTRGRAAMQAALAMNNFLSFDRNRLPDPQKHLPAGRIIAAEAYRQHLPGLADQNVTGVVAWHDAQMYNSERLTLSCVLAAAAAGASVANYVAAIGFLRSGQHITGICAKDVFTDVTWDLRAKIVVNAAGPWVGEVLNGLGDHRCLHPFYPSVAMNLVTRQIIPRYAAAIPSRHSVRNGKRIPLRKPHMLLIVPWRSYSLIGTVHLPYEEGKGRPAAREQAIGDFVDEVNAAYPGAQLGRYDVHLVHTGLLPAKSNYDNGRIKLLRQSQIIDHRRTDGLEGLITVVGVKYTLARYVAEKVVDLAFQKLGEGRSRCRSATTPLRGGQIEHFDDFLAEAIVRRPRGLSPAAVGRLVRNYGSEYRHVLAYLDERAAGERAIEKTSQILVAEVKHGIRVEMAHKLADVIQRRTELGSAGRPAPSYLDLCAEVMAAELGWNRERKEREIMEIEAIYTRIA